MISHWYVSAIFSLILLGTQRFLYKVSAEKQCNTAWTTCAFMAVSYAISTAASFGLRSRLAAVAGDGDVKTALTIGFAMGVINFAGFYLMLNALSTGPLSIVVSLVGMHFVIAVILSTVIYKEMLTPLKTLGVALTVVSVILLRLQ